MLFWILQLFSYTLLFICTTIRMISWVYIFLILPACTDEHHVNSWYPSRLEESNGSPGTGIKMVISNHVDTRNRTGVLCKCNKWSKTQNNLSALYHSLLTLVFNSLGRMCLSAVFFVFIPPRFIRLSRLIVFIVVKNSSAVIYQQIISYKLPFSWIPMTCVLVLGQVTVSQTSLPGCFFFCWSVLQCK